MKVWKLFAVCIVLITFPLSGCMYSAAMTGAQAVYDHNNLKKRWNNHYASLQANKAIYLDTDKYNNTHVSVAAINDSILITGQAPNPSQKHEIENIVKTFSAERKVYNFIEVTNPTSSLTRMSDSWITTKVKTKIIANDDIDPSQIKVITENGIVYLLGTVLPRQAEIATELALETAGVLNVIKVFSYVHITKA